MQDNKKSRLSARVAGKQNNSEQQATTQKTKNLSTSGKTTTGKTKPIPVRFSQGEIKLVEDQVEAFEEDYENLNRSDMIRAAVRLLKSSSKKAIDSAISDVKMGKAI